MRAGAIAAAGVTALALLGVPATGAAPLPVTAPVATRTVAVADIAPAVEAVARSAVRPSTCRTRLRKARARAAHLPPRSRRAAVAMAQRALRRCLARARATAPADPPVVVTVPGPPAPAATSSEFAFLVKNADGSPARWNPCKPITWRVNPAGAPTGAAALVARALAKVSAATGLTFVDGGSTTEVPFVTPPAARSAQLLVGFGTVTDFPTQLAPPTVGYGGPEVQWTSVADAPTPKEVVAGQVVLSADAHLAGGFGPRSWGDLLLHEVGHAMNLGHVDAAREIMNPSLTSQQGDGYAVGDLAGLAHLGAAGGCFPKPLR